MVRAEPRDVLQQVEEGRLGPVDVIEQDDERRLRREDLEQAAHRPERLLDVAPARAVLAEPDRVRDAFGDLGAVLGVRDERAQLGARGVRRVRLVDRRGLLDQLGDRPERDALAVGQAPGRKHTGAIADARDELGHQA